MSEIPFLIDPKTAFLDRHDVAAMLKCGESKIRELETAGSFPKPLRLGSTATPVWMITDILAWAVRSVRGAEEA